MNDSTAKAALQVKHDSKPAPHRWFHFWPLACFLVLLLFFDYLLSLLGTFAPVGMGNIYLGVLLGHLFIASVTVSFAFSSWIAGMLLSSFFAIFFFAAFIWGYGYYLAIFFSRSDSTWSLYWLITPAPFIFLAGAIPLLLAKSYYGWSIHRSNKTAAQPSSIRVEDLFLTIIVLASISSLLMAPSIAMEIDREVYMKKVIQIAGISLLSTFLGGLPCVWLAFSKLGWLKRIMLQLTWMFTTGVFLLCPYFEYTSIFLVGGIVTNEIARWLIATTFATLLPIGFLLSLRASRLRFTAIGNHRTAKDKVEDLNRVHHPKRWIHRLGAVAFVVLAIGIHISARIIDYSRVADDQFLAEQYWKLQSRGGEIRVLQGKIVAVAFSAPGFQLNDLEQFPAPVYVEALSLAHAEIDDSVLSSLTRFPELTSLDLSYTGITDAAVPDLRELTKLRHLSISGTRLSQSSIHHLASLWHLNELDLGDLNLTDRFRMPTTWSLKPERSLSLRGNREITDRWSMLPENDLSRGRLGYLDLSGTGVTGVMFEKPISTQRLLLHDVAITDQILAKVATNINVTEVISLENTLLTDASLPVIASKIPARSWSLGDGNFTESGLASLTGTEIRSLELRGKQFTGACFEKWNPLVHEVILTGSSVSDETIVALRNLHFLRAIGLAGTAITDQSLAEIAKFPMRIGIIDVSDTKVTVEGLLKHIGPFSEIVVRPGQFKPEELRALRSRMRVSVGQAVRSYR